MRIYRRARNLDYAGERLAGDDRGGRRPAGRPRDERLGGPHADRTCAEMVMRACGAAGFQPNVVAEATDHSVQLRLVAAGIGVALVPRLAAQPPRARLLPLHPRVQRHHFALTRSSATSDSGIRRIVELLDEHAARLLADPALPTG